MNTTHKPPEPLYGEIFATGAYAIGTKSKGDITQIVQGENCSDEDFQRVIDAIHPVVNATGPIITFASDASDGDGYALVAKGMDGLTVRVLLRGGSSILGVVDGPKTTNEGLCLRLPGAEPIQWGDILAIEYQ